MTFFTIIYNGSRCIDGLVGGVGVDFFVVYMFLVNTGFKGTLRFQFTMVCNGVLESSSVVRGVHGIDAFTIGGFNGISSSTTSSTSVASS